MVKLYGIGGIVMRKITEEKIKNFKSNLYREEKADATIEKYVRDVKLFMYWCEEKDVNREMLLEYKKYIVDTYKPTSANSMISSLNCFFAYMGWQGYKIKPVKIQRKIFADKSKELSKKEYEKLLNAAWKKGDYRLYYIMQTICSTGIRISELRFVTTDAVKNGQAIINCKGKIRTILLPKQLCNMLLGYIKKEGIKKGSVFISKNGNPMDRSNIWTQMKKLCKDAGVLGTKVFPHNFRHLFARTFYAIHKDIIRLSDILGHSNINTTRIYTMETGIVHRFQIQKLGLLRC